VSTHFCDGHKRGRSSSGDTTSLLEVVHQNIC